MKRLGDYRDVGPGHVAARGLAYLLYYCSFYKTREIPNQAAGFGVFQD
jgi:hypothetical protein